MNEDCGRSVLQWILPTWSPTSKSQHVTHMASATRGPPHRSTRPSLNLPRLESTPNMCLLAVEHLKPQPPPKKGKASWYTHLHLSAINQDSCRLGSGWRLRPTIRSICICNLTHTNTHTTPMSCLGDCLATTPSIPFARRMTELARHALATHLGSVAPRRHLGAAAAAARRSRVARGLHARSAEHFLQVEGAWFSRLFP